MILDPKIDKKHLETEKKSIKCFNCLEEKNLDCFKSAEHIIPQSFGKFGNRTLVLNRKINDRPNDEYLKLCDTCNQTHGDNLDNYLAYNSYEGCMLRFKYWRKPKEFKRHGKNATKFSLLETEYKDAFIEYKYCPVKKSMANFFPSQIKFKKKYSNEYKYFLLNENSLPSKHYLEKQGFSLQPEEIFIISDDLDDNAIKALLNKKEITIALGKNFSLNINHNAKPLVKAEFPIDRTIRRALTKIAFDYLAYWLPIEDLIKENFDFIRSYINNPFFECEEKTFFKISMYDEKRFSTPIPEHIIKLELKQSIIRAQLSLFSFLKYSIVLTHNFSKPFLFANKKKLGHRFVFEEDKTKNTVIELPFSDRIIIPTPRHLLILPRKY